MCFRRKSTSVSSRRRPRCPPDLALVPLAVLDLSKPVERHAHHFLLRMTGNADAKPYSVLGVSLTVSAVHWHDCKTADMAFAALAKRDAAAPTASAS